MHNWPNILFLLLAAHALCDTALQPRWLSALKRSPCWKERAHALGAHGMIHGGAVALVTGYWALGAAEALCHAGIDAARGRRWIDGTVDQLLHACCKIWWVVFMMLVAQP